MESNCCNTTGAVAGIIVESIIRAKSLKAALLTAIVVSPVATPAGGAACGALVFIGGHLLAVGAGEVTQTYITDIVYTLLDKLTSSNYQPELTIPNTPEPLHESDIMIQLFNTQPATIIAAISQKVATGEIPTTASLMINNQTYTFNSDDEKNILTGSDNNDYLYADKGNDHLIGHSGDDIFDGGEGIDTVNYTYVENDGAFINLQESISNKNEAIGVAEIANNDTDQLHSIENVVGTNYILPSLEVMMETFVYGQGGDDYIDGKSHNDYLNGQLGNDQLMGGSGHDTQVARAMIFYWETKIMINYSVVLSIDICFLLPIQVKIQ